MTAFESCERAVLRSRDREMRTAMITVTGERARAEARASDIRLRNGRARSNLDGMPITWKDVFDVEGTVDGTAGSASRSTSPRASADGRLVRRARDLGLITIGKTNLSELAFSGLGINQHYGTPINPNDPTLVPGGSSSGAAVAVATRLVPIAVGTDTSGSARVPAAFCGCVGFRASKNRYGPDDFVALSPTLDSVGIHATTVSDIAALDRLLAIAPRPSSFDDDAMRAVIPAGEWIDVCTVGVSTRFNAAIDMLRDGAIAADLVPLTSLSDAQRLMDINGTIVGAEAHARYGHCLSAPTALPPATQRRLAQNANTAATLSAVRSAMAPLRRRLVLELGDAVLLCPTVRHEPPRIDDVLADGARYDTRNASTLRTTMVLSYLGMCSISLPLPGPDGLSTVGLMASLPHGEDDRLLKVAGRIVKCLGGQFA